MNILRSMAVGWMAAALAGCGSHDTSMMSDYAADLGRHMDALRAEESAHAVEIGTATTPEKVDAAEVRHWQDTDDHLRRMDQLMGDMMSCADARGTSFDSAAFARAMQSVRTECDRHRSTMGQPADLAADRAEEARHGEAMGISMDEMQTQREGMMRVGTSYSCSHCRHCGM